MQTVFNRKMINEWIRRTDNRQSTAISNFTSKLCEKIVKNRVKRINNSSIIIYSKRNEYELMNNRLWSARSRSRRMNICEPGPESGPGPGQARPINWKEIFIYCSFQLNQLILFYQFGRLVGISISLTCMQIFEM